VLDATRLLRNNGPQGGNPEDVEQPRTMMAGVDPVAIEAFGAHLLGLSAAALPQIARAVERGMGSASWERPGLATIDLES
jgi:uncharacterized protein (DUF362 family)